MSPESKLELKTPTENDVGVVTQPKGVNADAHTPVMGEEDQITARRLSLSGVQPPAKVPGYEQEEFLGHGSYGEVWVAINQNSGRKVAIKYYTRRGGLDWASLNREVEKLRYLYSDRYVVQLMEVGWESDPPYYVMEYMENGSLEELLQLGTLSVPDAVGYFREIAVALVHAHNKGIFHCDLKPGNVLLDQDKRPRLADFGQSRLTNEMTPALGTLYYMAPEQADLVAAPDARWDVYALGAVMYRMITGKPPHYKSEHPEGNLEAQLAAYRKLILFSPKPEEHRSIRGVDHELASIIDRCLASSSGSRFTNPQAVVSAIDAWNVRRVRKPLLFIMLWTFVLMFLVIAAIGAYFFSTSVITARKGVVDSALEANRFAAQSEAKQFGTRIQLRWAQLEGAARDGEIQAFLKNKANVNIDSLLAQRRDRGNSMFDEQDRSPMWFLVDAQGFERAEDPPSKSRNQYRGYHDFFNGQGRELPNKNGPRDSIIHEPYRSMVYHRGGSSEKGVWSVAFSVPVWDEALNQAHDKSKEPIGVMGLVLDLKGHSDLDANSRVAALIDTRLDTRGKSGLIVRHPYMQTTPPDNPDLFYYAEDVVHWSDEWKKDHKTVFPLERDYKDPVGGDYGGSWLAAAVPVLVPGKDGAVNSDWVVMVQAKQDSVLAPVRILERRLAIGAVGATAFLLLLLLALSTGITSMLDVTPKSRVTRLIRRWAGLAQPGVSVSATASGTSGGAVAGGKTARVGSETSTSGTEPKTAVGR
jgi:hypothetical protein